MTEEEKIRVVKLEGEVDVLRKRVDDLINGIVDTIKNHPIMKHGKTPDMKSERRDNMEKVESTEKTIDLLGPEGIEKFLKLCDRLKYYMLEVLDSLDQTDDVVGIRNRLKNTTIWNEIFDLSILGIGEQLRQLKEKRGIKHDKKR